MDRSMPYKDEPGMQDASVSDFLLPLLLGRLPMGKAASMPEAAAYRSAPVADDVAGSELRNAMLKSMELPAKGYAEGGVIEPDLGHIPLPNEQQPTAARTSLPSIMNNSQALGRQLYGGYTPEKRNELYSMLLQGANSMPSSIGSGLASVGDAITRGYGQNQSNFLDKTLQGQKDARTEALGAFDTAQKGTAGMVQNGMELSKITPDSDLSKLAQQSYAGPLKKLGYTDEQIAHMPASQIESVSQVALKYADIESQNELKKATIELQGMLNSSTIRNRKDELELAKTKAATEAQEKHATRQAEAAKTLESRGVLKRVGDWVTQNPGTKVLQAQAAGKEAPVQVDTQEEYNALPIGTSYIDSHGKPAVKKANG